MNEIGALRPTELTLSHYERSSIAALTVTVVPPRSFGCGIRCKAFSEGV